MRSTANVDAQVKALTRINSSEFVDSLGLGWVKHGRGLLADLCAPAARQVSEDMARFDRIIARQGLRRGAREVLSELVGGLEVDGAEHLPPAGPLLIAANHPGLCDVLTIFATVERDDLLVVAADYPLLRALRGINRHITFVPHTADRRREAFNRLVAHLRGGGAALILPAGEIEPDPALSEEAVAVLSRWSSSIGLLVHRVDAISVVPAVVSGVLLPRFQRHPLTWIRRRAADRRQLGTALQVLARASAATVRLRYGRPMARPDLRRTVAPRPRRSLKQWSSEPAC